jgi:hypothetical protein
MKYRRGTQFFWKWNTTSIYLDERQPQICPRQPRELILVYNLILTQLVWRGKPPFLENGRNPQFFLLKWKMSSFSFKIWDNLKSVSFSCEWKMTYNILKENKCYFKQIKGDFQYATLFLCNFSQQQTSAQGLKANLFIFNFLDQT